MRNLKRVDPTTKIICQKYVNLNLGRYMYVFWLKTFCRMINWFWITAIHFISYLIFTLVLLTFFNLFQWFDAPKINCALQCPLVFDKRFGDFGVIPGLGLEFGHLNANVHCTVFDPWLKWSLQKILPQKRTE